MTSSLFCCEWNSSYSSLTFLCSLPVLCVLPLTFVLSFPCLGSFVLPLLLPLIVHIAQYTSPQFLLFFPHCMSSSRSLSPFDPCYLFCPAVFSLIPSVSLQGCNTSILSQADKAYRPFSTAHFQSRVRVMDPVVSHRHERCCCLSCFFTIIVAVTMLPYLLNVTKHFLPTVISNSAQ